MNSPITPLGARVIAKREAAKTTTRSGLYLPEAAKEAPVFAIVTAVGPDAKQIKTGDKILYKDYAATEIKINDDTYLVVEEKDILGTIA